jgi:hypothetical protein
MIPKPDRTGHVAPSQIENREDGPGPAAALADAPPVLDERLRARIEAARLLEPKPNERHCRDCFNRGRNAAIRAILGE